MLMSLKAFRPRRTGTQASTNSSVGLLASADMAMPACDDAGQRQAGVPHWHAPGAAVLGTVVRPFENAGRYYTQSWRDYLDGEPGELPLARPTFCPRSRSVSRRDRPARAAGAKTDQQSACVPNESPPK